MHRCPTMLIAMGFLIAVYLQLAGIQMIYTGWRATVNCWASARFISVISKTKIMNNKNASQSHLQMMKKSCQMANHKLSAQARTHTWLMVASNGSDLRYKLQRDAGNCVLYHWYPFKWWYLHRLNFIKLFYEPQNHVRVTCAHVPNVPFLFGALGR